MYNVMVSSAEQTSIGHEICPNMTYRHGAAKHEIRQKGISDAERVGLFDPSFMDTFSPALQDIQTKGIKVAVNAGASDTEMLAKLVEKVVKEKGLTLKVAWICGDDVMDVVNDMLAKGEKFENICFGGELKDWGFEPLAAQCYLGMHKMRLPNVTDLLIATRRRWNC